MKEIMTTSQMDTLYMQEVMTPPRLISNFID